MNHYPEVASFVRDKAHVERYKNLKVKYIDHHNPDLVLLARDGTETHRVDLTRLSSTHSIHKLCQLLGLKEICRDENGDSTPEWDGIRALAVLAIILYPVCVPLTYVVLLFKVRHAIWKEKWEPQQVRSITQVCAYAHT